MSWNRTNRLGARLYVIGGLSICLCALADVSALRLAILVGGFGLGSTAIFQGYSYLLWRRDPGKTAFQRPDRNVLAERKDLALRRLILLVVLGLAFAGIGAHNFGAQGADWFSAVLGGLILGYGVSQFYTARKSLEWELPRSTILTVLGLAIVWFGAYTFRAHGANWAPVCALFVVLGVLLSGNGIAQFYSATKY